MTSKACKQCGTMFHRTPDESSGTWWSRKYCSLACNSAARRKVKLQKPSKEAAQVANYFLYKQKPWITENV